MAATIHATLKGESSNSYVTLAEANSYFETSPDDSTWTNKSDDQKLSLIHISEPTDVEESRMPSSA